MAKKKETPAEFMRGLLFAVLIAVGIRTFFYEPFNIPSGSMKDGLLIGDFLFVSKFKYGFTHYSFPFSPNLFSGRIMGSSPEVGDVVVFRGPFDPDTDYIKRCVGMPGDTIQMRDGILHINGQPCPVEPAGEFVDHLWLKRGERYYSEEGKEIPVYIETLPNGVKHRILKEKPFGQGRLDNTQVYVVPKGHYFMMGDNRDGSSDSRVLSHIGYVPYENLIGEASLIFFSTDARLWEVWRWPFGIRFDRIMKIIR